MKKVILVSGKIGNGKNQFSQYLKEEFEKHDLKVSFDLFAKSLKDWCKEDFKKLSNILDNISEEIKAKVGAFTDNRQMIISPSAILDIEKTIDKLKIKDENWYENKTDITRNILQLYGTEIFRRRVDDNWWVNQVKNRLINSNSDVIIVTDCRFPNEIIGIYDEEKYETFVIRIERNINTKESIASHDSETALNDWDQWDYIIENNGTLDDLKNSAKVVADSITNNIEDDYSLFTGLSKKENKILSQIIKGL